MSNIGFAQTFNTYNFNTQYSDQLIDIQEYETGYLLSGYQSDTSPYISTNISSIPILLKLSKMGYPIDTLVDTINVFTDLVLLSEYRNGYFYTFGSTNNQNDSNQLVVSKYDTLLNFVERKIYSQLTTTNLFGLHKSDNNTDSTIYMFGSYQESVYYDVKSFVFCYDFEKMSVTKFKYIPLNFNIYNLIVDYDRYIATGMYLSSFQTGIITFDSTFNIITKDTLFDPEVAITNATLQSVIGMKRYGNSGYICLGENDILYPFNNPTHYISVLALLTLDSSFQTQSYKYWYIDNNSYYSTSYNNSLICNKNKEYFLGAFFYIDPYYPDSGLFIVKIDSNLNTIWQKHIECTSETMCLMNMLPTDDGGVLILYEEQASITGAELKNSKLMKIESNGEVTSIIDFKMPINKPIVSLYPNPVENMLFISLLSDKGKIQSLNISDIKGKAILQKQTNSREVRLDVGRLSLGVYILQGVTNSGQRFSRKFVKE